MSLVNGKICKHAAEAQLKARQYDDALTSLQKAMVALIGERAAASIPLSTKNGGGMQSRTYIDMNPNCLLSVMECCPMFAECHYQKGDYVKVYTGTFNFKRR